jgi:hypothetical protein
MSHEIAKTPVDPTQFPEAAHKHASRALREHQRAEQDALNAVQHAVKSGQALLKAYDLCEYGHWEAFFEMHFQQDEHQRLPPRTARTYMRLARNWSRLSAQHPQGFSSQRQAMKALAAIVQADKLDRDGASSAARGRSGDGAMRSDATAVTPSLSQRERQKKRTRTGPVWRASGPFVKEAWRLMSSVDETLAKLVSRGHPLEREAGIVHEGLKRSQTMLDREIDEAEALQAAGEWTFVAEQAPPADSRPLSIDIESEDDHDN